MEITCTRCHQAIVAENCYCPTCGLPQLMYSAESVPGQAPPERFNEPVRDASTVDWKRALPMALSFAIPAGLLCPLLNPLGFLGFFLTAISAYWAVVLYVRKQRPAWITIGAGARIGLVTGLVSGWLACAAIGVSMFAMRVFFHQGKVIDDLWNDRVLSQLTEQSMSTDTASLAILKAWFISPEGRAGLMLGAAFMLLSLMVLFAIGGGALGARSQAHARRPNV